MVGPVAGSYPDTSPQVTRGEVPRDWLDKFVSWMMNGTGNGGERGEAKQAVFF